MTNDLGEATIMILAIVGAVIYLIGSLGLLIDEFRVHILWGLLGLFTQIGHFIFALCHFDKCKGSLGLIALGVLLIIVGVLLFGS